MDPLIKITRRSVELARAAEKAFCLGHPLESYEYLGELYNFLLDEIAGPVSDKCESAESSAES